MFETDDAGDAIARGFAMRRLEGGKSLNMAKTSFDALSIIVILKYKKSDIDNRWAMRCFARLCVLIIGHRNFHCANARFSPFRRYADRHKIGVYLRLAGCFSTRVASLRS